MYSMKLVPQGQEFLSYLKRFGEKEASRQPEGEEGNVFLVRYFDEIFIVVVCYISGESGFGSVEKDGILSHKVWVVSFPNRFEPSDGSNVKKCECHHTIGKMKIVVGAIPKIKIRN